MNGKKGSSIQLSLLVPPHPPLFKLLGVQPPPCAPLVTPLYRVVFIVNNIG